MPAKLQLLRQLALALHVHEREWIAPGRDEGLQLGHGGADAGAVPVSSMHPPPRGQTAAAPDPWAVLGIAPTPASARSKRAYRKLMSESTIPTSSAMCLTRCASAPKSALVRSTLPTSASRPPRASK